MTKTLKADLQRELDDLRPECQMQGQVIERQSKIIEERNDTIVALKEDRAKLQGYVERLLDEEKPPFTTTKIVTPTTEETTLTEKGPKLNSRPEPRDTYGGMDRRFWQL